ncbi:hypothetical protein ACFPRL_14395 [Pseudoclavibacter helvolus]
MGGCIHRGGLGRGRRPRCAEAHHGRLPRRPQRLGSLTRLFALRLRPSFTPRAGTRGANGLRLEELQLIRREVVLRDGADEHEVLLTLLVVGRDRADVAGHRVPRDLHRVADLEFSHDFSPSGSLFHGNSLPLIRQ